MELRIETNGTAERLKDIGLTVFGLIVAVTPLAL